MVAAAHVGVLLASASVAEVDPSDTETVAGDAGPASAEGSASGTWADEDVLIGGRSEFERGESLGRYVVLDHLGAGGMGVVFAAYDPELDRKVAVKLIRAGLQSESARERLHREAQAMARLSHPNVVPVHDVGEHAGQTFVAMEFVEGRTLKGWLIEKRRSVDEVLDVFVQAGRGLAAAHEKGLIHRDFKPDNVMVGEDGRVRVMDFGLVRAAADEPSARTEEDEGQASADDLTSGSRSGRLSDQLTKVGRAVGTPAYMSPEQHTGLDVDARTDVFSYCVALYEALYGRRPFQGRTAAALATAIATGDPDAPPANADVPGWLRDAVMKGLATRRGARWESIEAMLEVLTLDRGARKRRWIVYGGVAAAVVAGVAFGQVLPNPAPTCEGAAEHLNGVWDDARKGAAEAAFRATDLPYAADAWEASAARLDAWAEAWTAGRTDACEATQVRHEQSEAVMDQRMACLDERMRELRALSATFIVADADVVEHAVDAAANLPDVAPCADRDYVALASHLRPPPELASAVDTQREELAHARALGRSGKYADALADARVVLEAARDLEWEPLVAEALVATGELEHHAGEHEVARASTKAGYFSARRSGADRLARDAAIDLIELYAGAADVEAARAWAEHAEAELAREADERAAARLEMARGVLAQQAGDYDQMLEHFAAAVEMREALHPEGDLRLVNALIAQGGALRNKGRHEESVAVVRRAVQMAEQVMGPSHPESARARRALGSALFVSGDVKGALGEYQASLEVAEAALGPDHSQVAVTLTNVGMANGALGRFDASIPYFERALAIKEKTLGKDHPSISNTLNNLGASYCNMNEVEKCAAIHERNVALRVATLGPEHPQTATATVNLADARAWSNDFAGAQKALESVPEAAWTKLAEKEEILAQRELAWARIRLGQGRAKEGLARAETALELRAGTGALPTAVADTKYHVAWGLLETGGDRSRASRLAEEAVATWEEHNPRARFLEDARRLAAR